MDSPSCRLLPYEAADGPSNMAADEVLLEAAGKGVASLRFYGWSVPTLSLGYFQTDASRLADPPLAELPWVRRASGGAALVHHYEITYALALPPGPPWQRRGESWICRMHGIIRAALSSLGITAQPCGQGEERGRGEFLCFLHNTPGDVLIDGHKVVGSAQRKQHGAVLQHGSILLSRSLFTPSLPGIADLSGMNRTSEAIRAAIIEHFGKESGWQLRQENWSDDEIQRRTELADAKYSRPAWNVKR